MYIYVWEMHACMCIALPDGHADISAHCYVVIMQLYALVVVVMVSALVLMTVLVRQDGKESTV